MVRGLLAENLGAIGEAALVGLSEDGIKRLLQRLAVYRHVQTAVHERDDQLKALEWIFRLRGLSESQYAGLCVSDWTFARMWGAVTQPSAIDSR